MTATFTDGVADLLDARHIERTEEIPTDPDPGNYVVIDVLHFSTTVVELLANGASYVHVTEERGEEFAFREDNPEARIGGGSTATYEPAEGYDFFNSPSYVQGVDVSGRPVSMTSSNGGRALWSLRAADADVDVYVGTTTNAAAVAERLRGDDRPTYLVSAGSKGEEATEDHVGAVLLARYLAGEPPADVERQVFRDVLEVAKGHDYVDKHEVRRRDVQNYAMAIDSRSVVPHLVGDRLVDVSGESTLGPAVADPASD